jgi:hypothetical protein
MTNHYRYLTIIGMAFVVITLLTLTAGAVPPAITYQGQLTDGATGTPITDPGLAMTFRIYDAATGGVLLWEEEHVSVPVDTGIYTVIVGSGTTTSGSFDPSLFSQDNRWLEVLVEGEVFDPRQQLTSVAYAFRAATATDADTLDGSDSLDFAEAIHYHSFTDITDTATDAQIPDDITINYAAAAGTATTAGNADTVDSKHASDFAGAVHTHSFTDMTDSATDAQIPDTITINQAGNADTVDGEHADAFADAVHNHDNLYYTQAHVDGLESRIAQLETTVSQLVSLLQNVTRSGNDITFSGVNVHVVNGTGTTYGTVNGLGNLIVGYNELRSSGNDRTGSHNIVVGSRQNYSSYGGLVAGYQNAISGAYASVSGGYFNAASSSGASVSGGYSNTASYFYASVSGGYLNTASGNRASVSGGHSNTASGTYSSISGGRNNEASGQYSFVGGGGGENATDGNEAYANYSAILGGFRNVTGDKPSEDHTIGIQSTVSGGNGNIASGLYSSISGGAAGTAEALSSSITGGWQNTATGSYSSILGGRQNSTADTGGSSTVGGGANNTASGVYATVTGGQSNGASGLASTVSGGYDRSISDTYEWCAGSLRAIDPDGSVTIETDSEISLTSSGGTLNLSGVLVDLESATNTEISSGGSINLTSTLIGLNASSGGMPAARLGDMVTASGGVGSIITGSATVRIGD